MDGFALSVISIILLILQQYLLFFIMYEVRVHCHYSFNLA